MDNYKIGMIGTEEAIAGFNALGVHCFYMNDDTDIEAVIEALQKETFAVVYITDDWAQRVRRRLDEAFRDVALPAIVTVPSQRGSSTDGLSNLRKIVEQAVGSDILFSNQ